MVVKYDHSHMLKSFVNKFTTLGLVVDSVGVEGQGEMRGIDGYRDGTLVGDGELEGLQVSTGHIDVVL